MDPFALFPLDALLHLAYSGVAALATLLVPFAGGSSAASAVVLVTLLVRLATLPLGIASARAAAASRRLQPRIRELRRRFAKRPERLREELIALHRDERVSPFAGVLPLLAQAPVFTLLYGVFSRPEIGGVANVLLSASIGDAPLARAIGAVVVSGVATPSALILAAVLAVVLVAVAEASRRLLARQTADAEPRPPAFLGFLPYSSLVVAALVPAAAALYLTVSAVWGVVERAVLARRFRTV